MDVISYPVWELETLRIETGRLKPQQQLRQVRLRGLDTRTVYAFGFRAQTPFEVGLRRTIDWYQAEHSRAR